MDSTVLETKVAAERSLITIAIAGNPNSGKSTLINAIAGTKLHVGNWPGVTVEKKETVFDYRGRRIRLVDLPGTYSLSPYTQEEIIARDYLVHEKPDVVINVVDATNLERNLYLSVQILELEIPVVMALNIYDEAERKGFSIDKEAMQEMLDVTIVPTVATKKTGLSELFEAVVNIVDNGQTGRPRHLNYGNDIEAAAGDVQKRIMETAPSLANKYPLRWLALKVLEGDDRAIEERDLNITDCTDGEAVKHLVTTQGDDIESLMADARYAQASGLTKEVLTKPSVRKTELTERIDRVVLNRYLGIPIFLAAMWLVFKLTFDVSTPFGDWIDEMTAGPFMRWTSTVMTFLRAPDWMISLATDGVIAGVGFVLVFVPVVFAMMFFITFLEGSGYMARAAFVMDRAMHSMGLHGKSFIPMLLGFGCNVPGIYATRTLENNRDKALTALLIPLMSCGARLPVYVLFVSAFFAASSGTVLWSLYVLGIVMAIIVGIIFKKTIFRGDSPMFIMELPPYRFPSMRNLMIHTWEKGKHFLIKAGTYIFAVSIIVWFLLNLPWGVEHKKDSFLGQTAQVVAPAFEPLGFGNWEASAALITGIIAKEIVVGTMGEIYIPASNGEAPEEAEEVPTFGEDLKHMTVSFGTAARDSVLNVFSTFGVASISAEEDEEAGPLKSKIMDAFTPLSAYSFMTFVLLYMPCVIVLVAMKHEFATWKWAGLAFGYQMVLAWTVSFIIYQGGKALGLG